MSSTNQADVPSDVGAGDSFEAAMAAMSAAVGQAQPAAAPAGQPQATPPAPQPTVTAEALAAPTTTEPAVAPPSQKELERIVALEAREAKLREREAAIEARQREASQPAPATTKAPESSGMTDRQWADFLRNPVGFVRKMKPDLSPADAAAVAESFYGYTLGDKAPLEIRQRLEAAQVTTEVRSEVDELRTELKELRAERAREAQEAERAKYRSELRAGATSVKEAPIVANLVQRDPDYAAELLFEVARRAAIEAVEQGAAPVVLSPAEAVAKLEKVLIEQRDRLYGPSSPAPAQAPSQQSAPPSPTLTNRDAGVRPGRTVTDSTDDKELRRAALEAAGLGHVPVWD